MDFPGDSEKTHGLSGSRLARTWLSQGIPPGVRTDLQARLRRMEPEISRLVQLYDVVAAEIAGDASLNGSAVLDESWCAALGIPSEVDIRAAAVRLFASETHTPTWLTRRSGYKSMMRESLDRSDRAPSEMRPGVGSAP
ncbi:MAG TPA: hypothetical protein VIY86_05085, partial [Pirellulaceae bacterium]